MSMSRIGSWHDQTPAGSPGRRRAAPDPAPREGPPDDHGGLGAGVPQGFRRDGDQGRSDVEARVAQAGRRTRLPNRGHRGAPRRDRARLRPGMILVDSNIPMYLVGAAHPNKDSARSALERAIVDGERLVTDAEVLQEILHRYV